MPMTVAGALKWGREKLKSAGIDELSAEQLLQFVLKFSKVQISLNPEFELDSNQEIEYKRLISEREKHFPLQYLIGRTEFYNIELIIDKRALIPRPETEFLVETVISKCKDRGNLSILDIGTGSGNIAIAVAKNLAAAKVTGVDISGDALRLAETNARINRVESRLKLLQGDIFDEKFMGSLGKFDCVVSNPPYVADSDRPSLQLEIVEYEPGLAVFAGDDPLRFFKTIVGSISYILMPGGILAFEVGFGQAGEVEALMRNRFIDIEITKDLAGIERVITGVYAGID